MRRNDAKRENGAELLRRGVELGRQRRAEGPPRRGVKARAPGRVRNFGNVTKISEVNRAPPVAHHEGPPGEMFITGLDELGVDLLSAVERSWSKTGEGDPWVGDLDLERV